MANNCLVTKLKSVVDNDNLEKLGILKLMPNRVDKSTPVLNLLASTTTYMEVTVKGDLIVTTDYNGQTYSHQNETYMQMVSGNYQYPSIIRFKDGDGYIEFSINPSEAPEGMIFMPMGVIFNKDLKTLAVYSLNYIVDIINYRNKLAKPFKVSEWLSYLDAPAKRKVKYINTYQTNCTFDITDGSLLGDLIILSEMNGHNSLDLDVFATAQVAAGRTSEKCLVHNSTTGEHTINYGSSMISPTAEETAQGYQIV